MTNIKFEQLRLVKALNRASTSTTDNDNSWQNAPANAMSWYFYETADTSANSLPKASVFVLVFKSKSGNRGFALAFAWPSGWKKQVWVNNLHGTTWAGWESMFEGS